MPSLRRRLSAHPALVACVAGALVFGCVGAATQAPATVGGAHHGATASHAKRGSGWSSPQARTGSHLIYWGDSVGGAVYIFPAKGRNQQPIGKISGGDLQSPNRLFVDRDLNLYVADGGTSTILVYPPGATTPSLEISDGVFAPVGLAVDTSGTVYCANVAYHTVTEYPAGATSPSVTITLPKYPSNLVVDRRGNLYVTYNGGSKSGGVMYFRHGATTGKDLGLDVVGPSAVEVDSSGNIIVADASTNAIDIFAPGATEPSRVVKVQGSPLNLSLSRSEKELYATVGLPNYRYVVQTLKYPAGTKLRNKIMQQLGQFPLAVSPDAP